MNTTNLTTTAGLPDAIRVTAGLLRRAEATRCNTSAAYPAQLSPLETESLLHLIAGTAARLSDSVIVAK